MAKWAIFFGLALVALGLVGYFGADPDNLSNMEVAQPRPGATSGETEVPAAKPASKGTALIPAAVGLLLMICGTLGMDSRMKKHAMHAAAGIAVLGTLACLGLAASKMGDIFSGNLNRATTFVLLMAAICLVYVVLSIWSFVKARQANSTK